MKLHSLLESQLRCVQLGPSDLDGTLASFLKLVNATYEEIDREREGQECANRILHEELKHLHADIRREAEAHVRATLDAVGDGVVIIDGEGRIDGFNLAATRIFGRKPGEAIGQSFSSLWDVDQVAPSLLTLESGSGEAVVRRPDGETLPVEVTVSEATLGGDKYRIAIVHDMSERMRAEKHLRAAMEQATAASKAKSDFLATMSHEIRTPMNGVLGMVGLLLDGSLEKGQRSCAEAIRDSGEALLAILNDILDFSKIEAGKLTLEEYDFAPADVVESVVELLAPRAVAKNIEIAVVTEPGVPAAARGDAGRLRQILMNLVGNAVKFTEKGVVVVEMKATATEGSGHLLRVDVVDTGVGIDADVLPHLFGEFVQADASTTRRFGGTGLGLAISKKLSLMMGGKIGVDSTKGSGSRFWFSIPLLASSEDSSMGLGVAGLRCLVVDDDPLNREIFERQLTPWGVEVVSTSSGDFALAELVKAVAMGRPFDVAIIDQHMPGMSGKELGSIVRAMPNLGGTRLLLATSGLAEGEGFDETFTKPVHPSALLRALAKQRTQGRTIAPMMDPRTHEPPPSESRRLRVLVVEDNSINQRVAVGYLERARHRVDVASNGLEALSAVRALPYDIVLMDVQMPEMDGLAATRAIRMLDGERGNVVIIGLTANAMREDRDACLAAGMTDYLAKPIDRQRLLEKLERWSPAERPSHRPSATLHPSPAPGPDLDASVLDELADVLGAEQVRNLLHGFVTTTVAFRNELEGLSPTELRVRAHQLKGSAGALGLMTLSAAAGVVDVALGRSEPIEPLRAGLLGPLDEAITALRLSRHLGLAPRQPAGELRTSRPPRGRPSVAPGAG